MDGLLNEHLHEVDTQCYERAELLAEQMKRGYGRIKSCRPDKAGRADE